MAPAPGASGAAGRRVLDRDGRGLAERCRADARTEWVWSGEGRRDAAGWKALAGVADLRVENGALRGRTAMPAPVLALDWTPPPEVADDKIHSIELRLRTSGGGRASFGTNFEEQVVRSGAARNQPVRHEVHQPDHPGRRGQALHVATVDADAVARRRHLCCVRSMPPAPSSRSSRCASSSSASTWRRFLPASRGRDSTGRSARPWSRAARRRCVSTRAAERSVPRARRRHAVAGAGDLRDHRRRRFGVRRRRRVRRTVSTPQRWEDVRVDLAGLGGKSTKIALRVEAADAGAIGLWGSPVVRSRVATEGRAGQPAGRRGGDHRHAAPRSPLGVGLRPRHRAAPLGSGRRGRGRRRRDLAGGLDQGLGAVDPHLALSRPRTRSSTSPTCCRRPPRPWPRCSAKRDTPPSGSRRSRSPAR